MGLFYLLYKVLLSRESFCRFNRVVLLSAFVLSCLLPLWVRLGGCFIVGRVWERFVVLFVKAFVGLGAVETDAGSCPEETEFARRRGLGGFS